jgi:hypothetical protein
MVLNLFEAEQKQRKQTQRKLYKFQGVVSQLSRMEVSIPKKILIAFMVICAETTATQKIERN